MYRRILCLLVCLLCLPALCGAEASYQMAGYDGKDSAHDWATNDFFVRMEKRTGISFTFAEYTNLTEWQQAKDKLFSSGELPDVLFKAALTTDELIRYTESGQLIDLKPLLEENAPHLWALLQQHPDWLQAVTLPSGKIGALPSIEPVPTQDALWINQDWLAQLGLDMPTDLASLREVLTAFRDQDPNGNGKQDEIPLGFLGPWELKLFSHAYGVVVNDYNLYLDEEGTVRFWPEEDSFVQLMETLRGLYANKLLDNNGFYTSDMLRRNTDDKAALCYGAFFSPTPVNVVTYEQSQSYGVVDPFVFEGKQVYRDLLGPVTRGAFAITSACDDPAALLRWADVLYTEEGAVEAMLGVEGDRYLINEDGYWQWKGGVENLSTAELNDLSVYDTGDMPWLFPIAFYERYAEEGVRRISAETDRLAQYVRRPFPVYTLTPAQSAEIQPVQDALGKYVDESIARFVLGEWELNPETVDAFRAELKQLGSHSMTAFWQAIADAQP